MTFFRIWSTAPVNAISQFFQNLAQNTPLQEIHPTDFFVLYHLQ